MEKIAERIRKVKLEPWLMIFYGVGVIGLVWPLTREFFQKLIPLTLLMSFVLLLIYHGTISRSFIWKALVVFAGGVLIEVAGVNTGLIFGEYSYGPSLGPKIFHTPVIIGINWLMLVYSSLVIAGRYIEDRYFRVLIASVMMVAYDFALEPAAINFDMWNWGGPVPLQNYLAWLIIAFVLNLFADRSGMIHPGNKIAPVLFFIQLVFFILLDLIMLLLKIWG